MIEKFDFTSISAEGRLWVASAIAGMICADGYVDDSEVEYLRDVIQFLDTKEAINDLVMSVKKKEKPVLRVLKLERDCAFKVMRLLTRLAVSDTRLSQSEAKFLKYAGAKLGFEASFSNQMMKWGIQRLEADKMEKCLWDLANRSVANYTDVVST